MKFRPSIALLAASAAAALLAVPLTASGAHADPSGLAPLAITTVHSSVTITSHGWETLTATCPAGTSPLTGGYAADNGYGTNLLRYAEYTDFGDGASYQVSLNNFSGVDLGVTAWVRCAPVGSLVHVTRVQGTFSQLNGSHDAGGYLNCPDGSYALSARVDWDDTNEALDAIYFSGPTWDMKGWYVQGHHDQTGHHMVVDLECVDIAQLPGARLATTDWTNPYASSANVHESATCPQGLQVLSGGSDSFDNGDYSSPWVGAGWTFTSYPDGNNAWTTFTLVPGADANNSYTTHTWAWCVPSDVPTVSFTSGPATASNAPVPSFAISATDPDAAGGYQLTLHCTIDGTAVSGCNGPQSSVDEGQHEMAAWATTDDGRRSATAYYDWVYDATPPTLTAKASAPFVLDAARFSWQGQDGPMGMKSYSVAVRSASYYGAFGSWAAAPGLLETTATSGTVAMSPGRTTCAGVSGSDVAGNTGSAPVVCTAMPLDDRSLTTSGGWTRLAGAGYWKHTATTTQRLGATLTIAGVRLDRVGIVATTCPTCGKVAVYVGQKLAGTIALHSTTAHTKRLIVLPRFAATTATVRLKVLTSNQPVTIDGLATSQA